MNQFYVYLHCKPDGTPFYVGKGHDHEKWGKRSHNFKDRSPHHKNIVAKYGKENIIIEVTPCINEQEALESEVLFILSLRDDGVELCNYTDGGDGVSGGHWKLSDEYKIKQHLIAIADGRKARIHTVAAQRKATLSRTVKIRGKYKLRKKPTIFKKVMCPYCKKVGGVNAMMRYHFSHCKVKY